MSSPSSPSRSEPKFRVAICGAGIAGLVLAITIGKYDSSIPIDLYEAHDTIGTAGVGITLWKRTQEILIELGLFDEFERIFTPKPDSSHDQTMRRSDIYEGGYEWFQRTHRYGPYPMHRQQMVAILEERLPASCTIHSKKRLVDYIELEEQDAHSIPPIRLEFADGTTATADVLIGADGVRSVVRKALFEAASEDGDGEDKTYLRQFIEATFTGMTIYRCLVPAEALRKESPENLSFKGMVTYHGKGKSFITYPIAKGTVINFAAFVADPSSTGSRYEGQWVSDVTRDELVTFFDNFEPDARAVVKLCEQPTKWGLHVTKPLPFCVRGRVALIGDACHAMTPHFGAGAGQAIEDAFVLGRLIAHPLTPLSRIPDALRIYEEVRLPFARDVASISLSTGWLYSFMEPEFYDGTRKADNVDDRGVGAYEREGMEAIKQEVQRRASWVDGLRGALLTWGDAESKLVN